MNKEYIVELDGKRIGTTALEKYDAPMGVVLGAIKLEGHPSGYDLFKRHCATHGLEVDDQPDVRCLMTQFMPGIRVLSPEGTEIKGAGITVNGFDDDGWEISILGIPYPFYGAEFPHHVRAYEEHFKRLGR
jgi:hypothetical protein